jgi:hypothetical protein
MDFYFKVRKVLNGGNVPLKLLIEITEIEPKTKENLKHHEHMKLCCNIKRCLS